MINIAIIEDTYEDYIDLKNNLLRFAEEKGVQINLDYFQSPLPFFNDYKIKYELVITDIEMELMDGVTFSKKLRQFDENIEIIYISKSAQYAINGYAMDVRGYILKPIDKVKFDYLMNKVFDIIQNKYDAFMLLTTKQGVKKINIMDIIYVEVINHHIHFNFGDHEIAIRDSLNTCEQKLSQYGFARCNNCYLVNLKYVNEIKDNSVDVCGKKLSISRSKKKSFIEEFYKYMGDNI